MLILPAGASLTVSAHVGNRLDGREDGDVRTPSYGRKGIMAVRHDKVCAVAACPSGAEGARVKAWQFLTLQ